MKNTRLDFNSDKVPLADWTSAWMTGTPIIHIPNETGYKLQVVSLRNNAPHGKSNKRISGIAVDHQGNTFTFDFPFSVSPGVTQHYQVELVPMTFSVGGEQYTLSAYL